MGLKAVAGYNPAAVAITGGTALFSGGSVTDPSIAWAGFPTSGFYSLGGGAWGLSSAAANALGFNYDTAGQFKMVAAGLLSWSSTSSITGTSDVYLSRAGANMLRYGGALGSTAATATVGNKTLTAIANNVATAILTVTIPNGAHSASLCVKLKGSLGAAGAIGANEATESLNYDIDIARTAGVNAVAVIGTAYGGTTGAAVAGADQLAVTGTISAISGAVNASNTFTVNITVARGAGTSDNHTGFARFELINDNASGVTAA